MLTWVWSAGPVADDETAHRRLYLRTCGSSMILAMVGTSSAWNGRGVTFWLARVGLLATSRAFAVAGKLTAHDDCIVSLSRFRSERVEGEVSETSLLVLVVLDKQGPMSLSDLAAFARVTLGSMSQTVRRLEQQA